MIRICWLVSLAPGTFVVYSYKYQHDDGRVSYPLCFIFSSPVGMNVFYFLKTRTFRATLSQLLFAAFWSQLLFLCLAGCRPEQQMMYAGSKNKLVQTVELTKVSEPFMMLQVECCCCCHFLNAKCCLPPLNIFTVAPSENAQGWCRDFAFVIPLHCRVFRCHSNGRFPSKV